MDCMDVLRVLGRWLDQGLRMTLLSALVLLLAVLAIFDP